MAARTIALVTGANKSIGYEIVKALMQSNRSYHVLMGSRSIENATAAIERLHQECPETKNTVEAVQIDLNSDESIAKAFDQVKENPGQLDVLINNAGATFDFEYLAGKISLREQFMKSYDVNVAGTNVVTHSFIPLLLKSADPRLIFVGGLSNINEAGEKYFPTPPIPAGWPKQIEFETIGYRSSKVALNMLMLDWNHKLKEDGVKVWSVAPGFLATDLGNVPHLAAKMGAGHPSAGGATLRRVVEGEFDDRTGKYVSKDGIMRW